MYQIKAKPEEFVVIEKSTLEPKKDGEYACYRLEKLNKTTLESIIQIAKFLHIPLKHIGFAGTKDKAAKTSQLISIKGHPEKRLESFKSKEITLTALGRLDNPISLGKLEGNFFEIVVRSIDNAPKELKQFKNYFGEQRFSTNNTEVGRALIKQDFKTACELIDHKEIAESLSTQPTNFNAAIRKLPKKIIMLYLHAYQSFLWNTIAEKINKDTILPIIGFGTEFEDEEIEQAYKELMKKENITLRDFIIKPLPNHSLEGDSRQVYTKIKELIIGNLEEDELNKGKKKCTVKFFLEKGCYATEAVKAIMT
ncbi:tRNA pseudouridine(13) synthase TruD [Candidatus Woesearchaeota archaeon]|nr:tRNA pseudouridine(13) synthase TruD [Candidatus Woesearchaeota archaeon]